MKYDYDVIIIGGGATGLGCALESVSRGYKTLLLEGHDFGKGTSSKSTKLVHGGIRYLANLDFALVKEGLEERYYFLKNAPHLARRQTYLIPMQNSIERVKYFIGTTLYDFLGGKLGLGKSKILSREQTLQEAPDLNSSIIKGGAIYLDGQFDDTRMLISLVKTFQQLGGDARNYHQVSELHEVNGRLAAVTGTNLLDDSQFYYSARAIINATGTLSDSLLDLAEPAQKHQMVAAAQGTHLVFDKEVFNSEHAILVPETSDGRVLFILPWHDKIVVGTTDVKVDSPTLEPLAQSDEIDFIINTLNEYSKHKVSYQDIRSVFCGQRPLVKPENSQNTAKISRKHELRLSKNGLITIVGGKWTIYRRMGEDTINFLEQKFNWQTTKSVSKELHLYGYSQEDAEYPLSVYGSNAHKIIAIQRELNNFAKIHPDLPYYQAEIVYQVRYELARTVEDVLLRRTRAMFLNATAALESAALVAELMCIELKESQEWVIQQLVNIAEVGNKFLVNKLQ